MAEPTKTIAPIQTSYAGCRFRSRIEARWAVFMDRMRIRWEYEPEGYDLPSGPYLPDFRVFDGAWFEVKGAFPTEHEQQLARDLALATRTVVYVAYGDIPRNCDTGNQMLVAWPDVELCPTDIPLPNFPFPFFFHYIHSCGHDLARLPRTAADVAFAAARSARFEHGEVPQ